MPLWAQKAEEVQLENARRKGTSSAQRSYDPFSTAQQMIVNAGGLGRDFGYAASISQQLTQGTMTDPKELKKAQLLRESNITGGGPQAPDYGAPNPAFAPAQTRVGNIDDINQSGLIPQQDGSIRVASPVTYEQDGKVYLLPTVVNGQQVGPQEAIDHFKRTGRFYGEFTTHEAAARFARRLTTSQAALGRKNQSAQQPQPGVPVAS